MREVTTIIVLIVTGYLSAESVQHVMQKVLITADPQQREGVPTMSDEELERSIRREDLVSYSRRCGTFLAYRWRYPEEFDE